MSHHYSRDKLAIKTEAMEENQGGHPDRRRNKNSHRRRSPSRSRSLSDSWRVFDRPVNCSRSNGRLQANTDNQYHRQRAHHANTKRRRSPSRTRSPQLFTIPCFKSEFADSPDFNGNMDMRHYLMKALHDRGLGVKQATETVDDILASLTSVVDTADVEKVQVYSLATLLDKAGYRSGHVGAHMVASLVMEFMKMDAMKNVGDIAKDVLNITKPRRDLALEALKEEEGFAKMSDKFDYYLRKHKDYDELISRDLAKCMVELWRHYGVSYRQLKDICRDNLYVTKRYNLRTLLNGKEDEGKSKPKLFSFKTLIDFTIKHFD